jgi:hypothetical protein
MLSGLLKRLISTAAIYNSALERHEPVQSIAHQRQHVSTSPPHPIINLPVCVLPNINTPNQFAKSASRSQGTWRTNAR